MKKKSVSRGGNNSTKTSKETVKYSVKKKRRRKCGCVRNGNIQKKRVRPNQNGEDTCWKEKRNRRIRRNMTGLNPHTSAK